jgi:hypothetical protein
MEEALRERKSLLLALEHAHWVQSLMRMVASLGGTGMVSMLGIHGRALLQER